MKPERLQPDLVINHRPLFPTIVVRLLLFASPFPSTPPSLLSAPANGGDGFGCGGGAGARPALHRHHFPKTTIGGRSLLSSPSGRASSFLASSSCSSGGWRRGIARGGDVAQGASQGARRSRGGGLRLGGVDPAAGRRVGGVGSTWRRGQHSEQRGETAETSGGWPCLLTPDPSSLSPLTNPSLAARGSGGVANGSGQIRPDLVGRRS